MKMITINLVQKKPKILYPSETTKIIIITRLMQPNGIFVVEVDLLQLQSHLIQFELNYLILLYCFKKEVLVKLLMEEILFKLDGFCKFFFQTFFQQFYSFNSFRSWNDENTNNGNDKSGTLPDGSYDQNTKIQYCTYGPSFCIIFFFYSFNLTVNSNLRQIVPLPPTNLQLTQKSSTSVTISWTPSEGSEVYYKIITSSTTIKYSSTSTTWNSLSPTTTYTFYIYAGKNNPSNSAETYETVGVFIFLL